MSESRAQLRHGDSGISSIGDVPKHWTVVELGRIGTFSKGGGGTKEDEVDDGVPCVRYGDLYTRHQFLIRDTRARISEESAARYAPIRYGDLLFAGSGETIEEIGKSAANLMAGPAYCGGDVILFRPSVEIDAAFLGYAADCEQATYQKACMGRGVTVMHIYASELKHLRIPLPPLDEQRDIAGFLDRETERIDSLIAKKRLLIERLQEYRTALITRTVTRGLPPGAARAAGLDPSPRLKPSGVEWLGDVPEHWEVHRLRRLADIGTGSKDTVDRRDSGEYPFFVRSQKIERIDSWSFEGEAVLTAGDGVGVGRVFHYINGRFDYHQRMYKFSGLRRVIGKFFFQYFRALLRVVVLQGTAKSTVDSLRLPMLQEFPVLCPPRGEQQAIVEYIERRSERIDALVANVERLIERLQEYRTALITAAVTGKIDVRDEVSVTADRAE